MGAHGLGSVLDDPKAVPFRDGPDLVHGTRQTGEVHGDDALGARGDGGLELQRIDIHGLPVHIHQHGNATLQDHRGKRAYPSEGSGDYLVARLEPQHLQADLLSRRGTVHD